MIFLKCCQTKLNYLSPQLDERQDSHLVLDVRQKVGLLLVLLLQFVLEPLAAFQHLAEIYPKHTYRATMVV